METCLHTNSLEWGVPGNLSPSRPDALPGGGVCPLSKGRGRGRAEAFFALLVFVLIVGACSQQSSAARKQSGHTRSHDPREVTVRPVIKATSGICTDDTAPPRTPEETGYFQLDARAGPGGGKDPVLCVRVGSAELRTSDFASAFVDIEPALVREEEARALADRIKPPGVTRNNHVDDKGLVDDLLPVVFIVGAACVVILFLWVTARNARRYGESFQAPEDLRRADDSTDPTGGSPNGGWIWPSF